jgi:sialate O-acetylesterase
LNPQVKWKISIPAAALASATFQDDVLYLKTDAANNAAPLYIYAPDGLNLQTESDAGGTVVETESDQAARSRAARDMRIAAERTLADSQKTYQADLVEDLNQKWQFATDPENMGDTKGYFKPEFDDKAWKNVSTIGPWQMNGFPDYHGTAWYRKTFNLSAEQTDPLAMGDKQLLLYFGAIDGDAEIYLNGVKIEKRVMADHSNGWEQPLAFNISGAVHTGENTVAVKVTKDRFAAGLYRGVAILVGVLPK